MKKKLNSKNALKLVAATSMTIFSLLSVFSATAAWFDSQRSLGNGANEMGIVAVEESFTLKVHHAVHADANGYYFNPVASATIEASTSGDSSIDDLSINLDPNTVEYSPMNQYHPLLIVVEYNRVYNTAQSPLTILASTDSYFMCDTEEDGSSKSGLNASGNPLSSAIHGYSFGYYSSAASNPTNFATATYSGGANPVANCPYFSASTLANDRNKHFSFASVSEITGTAHFDHNIDFFRASSGSYDKVVFIIDYNISLIEYICNEYLGNALLSEPIGFTCDWTTFI